MGLFNLFRRDKTPAETRNYTAQMIDARYVAITGQRAAGKGRTACTPAVVIGARPPTGPPSIITALP